MSIVRFTHLCDRCGKRGEEYAGWPSCRDCQDDVCASCDIESTRDEERNTTICRECAKATLNDSLRLMVDSIAASKAVTQ